MNTNQKVSKLLYFMAILLEKKDNHTKAIVFKKASLEIEKLSKSLEIFKSPKELDELPFVGEVISREIFEFIKTGRFYILEKELKRADPKEILQLAKSVGEETSTNIISLLGINNFDDLLRDFADGRFSKCLDKDSKQYQEIDDLLDLLPSWYSKHEAEEEFLQNDRPSAIELLDFDSRFRAKYKYSRSQKSEEEYICREGKVYCLYSQSSSARENDKLGDWVNVRFEKNGHTLKWVILTSFYGKLKNKRIVMGEEKESEKFYEIKK